MNNVSPLCQKLMLLSLLVLSFSCDDDEVSEAAKEDLIVMKAQYFAFNSDQTIVVADPKGRILKAMKATYWVDTPIPPPIGGYNGDLVNVFLVTASGSFYQVYAFMNLRRGADFDGPIYNYASPQLKPVLINFPAPVPFDRLSISTDFYGRTIENIADTVGLLRNLYAEGGQLFGQVIKNGEGQYGFIDIDQQNNTATFDPSEFKNASIKKTIKLDPGVNWASLQLTGTFDSESEYWGYGLYDIWGNSQLDVFYPDVPFAKYFSRLTYQYEERLCYEERESQELNLDYDVIKFNGLLNNADPRAFDIDLSGEFDYYIATYGTYDTFLHVYNSHRYESFSIPDFSDIYGLKKFPFSSLNHVSIQLIDEDELTEDQEYFKYFTSGKSRYSHNRRTVSFNAPVK